MVSLNHYRKIRQLPNNYLVHLKKKKKKKRPESKCLKDAKFQLYCIGMNTSILKLWRNIEWAVGIPTNTNSKKEKEKKRKSFRFMTHEGNKVLLSWYLWIGRNGKGIENTGQSECWKYIWFWDTQRHLCQKAQKIDGGANQKDSLYSISWSTVKGTRLRRHPEKWTFQMGV